MCVTFTDINSNVTACSGAFPGKIIVSSFVQKIEEFYGNRNLVTVFKEVRKWSPIGVRVPSLLSHSLLSHSVLSQGASEGGHTQGALSQGKSVQTPSLCVCVYVVQVLRLTSMRTYIKKLSNEYVFTDFSHSYLQTYLKVTLRVWAPLIVHPMCASVNKVVYSFRAS